MNEILELQSGQVAFISSLIAGFSLTIAVQIIRMRMPSKLSTACFLLFTASALLFLVALYIDVALSLKTSGLISADLNSAAINSIPEATLEKITTLRNIGTSAATAAFFLFVISISLVSWIESKISGVIISILGLTILGVLFSVRYIISNLTF
jgi:hypothetical protein